LARHGGEKLVSCIKLKKNSVSGLLHLLHLGY